MNRHIKRDFIKQGIELPKPPKIDKIDFCIINLILIFCVAFILICFLKKG